MRRLAVTALFLTVIAAAQWGLEPSSRAAGVPTPPRQRSTTLDHARASVPLPRHVALAPLPPKPVDEARRRTPTRAARSAGPRGDVWAALAACESGGNPNARSASGRYFGAFQFSLATWQSLGYGGNPTDYSYGEQVAAAQRLQARSGWGQWPRCSRRLGLR